MSQGDGESGSFGHLIQICSSIRKRPQFMIRRVEIPGGADCFDFMLKKHYHVKCIKCGGVFDVDMDEMKELESFIHDKQGFEFLDYDILFKGICRECQNKK